MAHYVQIPKDLNDIKQKFMFGLTKRQVVSFGIGGVLGIPLFFLTRSTLAFQERSLPWVRWQHLPSSADCTRKTESSLNRPFRICSAISKDRENELTERSIYTKVSKDR